MVDQSELLEIKKMNLQRNKTLSAIALVLLLTFSGFLVGVPTVKAQSVATVAYMAAEPNPVGVGQVLNVNFWVLPIPPAAADIYHGFMVQVTKPDGTSLNMGPYNSLTIGTAYFTITPDKVGTWTFSFTYPGETIRGTQIGAAQASTTVTVQQQAIQPYPASALPTGYWTRPIYGNNREWSTIAGNWLQRAYDATGRIWDSVGAYVPYSQAPRAPHVMWTLPVGNDMGGIVGGDSGDHTFYSGLSYESLLTPPVVMDGRLFYRAYKSAFGLTAGNIPVANSTAPPGVICRDLRTGQLIWENDNATFDVGQLFDYESGNQGGIVPYLWSIETTDWNLYDANTGVLLCDFNNALPYSNFLGSTITYGTDGTMFVYFLDGNAGTIAMWNSTKAFEANGLIVYSASENGFLRVHPGSYNWAAGVQWKTAVTRHPISFPQGFDTPYTLSITGISDGVILAYYGTVGNYALHIGYSAQDGHELWAFNRTFAGGPTGFEAFTAIGSGIYAQLNVPTGQWVAWSLSDGSQLWVSDHQVYPWGIYNGGTGAVIAYGRMYSISYDGYVHAFDITNGKELWKSSSGNSGLDAPYGTYPFFYGPIIADGVVFTGTGEHSPTQPLIRGEKLFAFDANSGKQLWNIPGLIALEALADGYLVGYNGYDNQIYVFGKGPSATTVNVSTEVVAQGATVLIKGTVTDQSMGQPGTAAIADANMGMYMANLKMQQPLDLTTVTGVPVTLLAHAPDGSTTTIAQITSDSNGQFVAMWTPPSKGLYTIIASFPGSDSYGSSYAEAALGVTAAISASSSSTAPLDLYIIIATIVIIIAIAIAVIVLRRK